MSNKLSPTRGLHRVERRDTEKAIATKVTGRNLASVSYIVALEAERRGIRQELRTTFGTNGSLLNIAVREGDDEHAVSLLPGQYLVLEPGWSDAVVMDPEDYQRYYSRVAE